MSSDRYVTVAWVYNAGELALLLSLFEWEEIPVAPIGYYHGSVQWDILVALGGIRLCVRAEDGQAARALLASIERTPQRTTRFFARDRLFDVLLVLVLFFLGMLAPPARVQAEFAPVRREEAA